MANGMGLLMYWCDIPADQEKDMIKFYEEEHFDRLLDLPGFLDGALYVAVSGSPRFLVSYELEKENQHAMSSPEYERHTTNPTEWHLRVSPGIIGYNTIRNLYQQVYPAELSPELANSPMAPALRVARIDFPAQMYAEFNKWYTTADVPNLEKVDGVIRGRLLKMIWGSPMYLGVWELEHEDVVTSSAWAQARDADPVPSSLQRKLTQAPGSPGVYKKVAQSQRSKK